MGFVQRHDKLRTIYLSSVFESPQRPINENYIFLGGGGLGSFLSQDFVCCN